MLAVHAAPIAALPGVGAGGAAAAAAAAASGGAPWPAPMGVPAEARGSSSSGGGGGSGSTDSGAAAAVAAQGAAAEGTPAAAPPAGPPAAAKPAGYSAASYWDSRYAGDRRGVRFDWFFSYAALRPLLRHSMPLPALPALHVGCGNSDLSVGLGEDGTPVVNTDISPVVIDHMRADAAGWPDGPARANCSWEVADCRGMPQYQDGYFGTVLDKGTLDAVLCSGTGLGDARAYVSESHRLLAPGGVLLLISLGAPDARLSVLRALPRRRRPSSADAATAPPPLWGAAAGAGAGAEAGPPAGWPFARTGLAAHIAAALETAAASAAAAVAASSRRDVRWARVTVYMLPKPSLYLQGAAGSKPAAAAAPSAAAAPAGDEDERPQPQPQPRRSIGKDEPVAWLGPFEVGPELEAALSAPGFNPAEYFYAYACYKPAAPPAPRSRRASNLASAWPAAAAAPPAAAGPLTPPPPAGAAAVAAAAAAAAALGGGAAPAIRRTSSTGCGLTRAGSGGFGQGLVRSSSFDGPAPAPQAQVLRID
ncbi:hypothetical protein Rsub_01692 [Raphidocelis subcapitata]|uniref:Methyltransferase type 11 domain-containing protein n=1 Tax=Raphidocelis subcapitata TaxID=307507 RepID=A0A2V0NMP3_9CHLO|nr:hypothetical protein Rsub_01692 [Raphidocelis subcapitata]|eukprot:GBF88791.1 hypothetical protein Rsub_01692 [Raphidocelis subcapitata]